MARTKNETKISNGNAFAELIAEEARLIYGGEEKG
jgi:hypothetical protein